MTRYMGDAKIVTYPEVARAASRYVAANEGEVELWRAYDTLARELGTYDRSVCGWGRQGTDRFRAQVRRAFDQMAVRGELFKIGRKDHAAQLRLGISTGEVRYYTPVAHEKARAARQAAASRSEQIEARWEAVHSRLGALKMPAVRRPGHPVELDLDSWEDLLSLAEQGQDELSAAARRR